MELESETVGNRQIVTPPQTSNICNFKTSDDEHASDEDMSDAPQARVQDEMKVAVLWLPCIQWSDILIICHRKQKESFGGLGVHLQV